MKVVEISVDEAFRYCAPTQLRRPIDKDKKIVCADCNREITKIVAVNDMIGVCSCGFRLFDWRPAEERGKVVDQETQGIIDVIIRTWLIHSK